MEVARGLIEAFGKSYVGLVHITSLPANSSVAPDPSVGCCTPEPTRALALGRRSKTHRTTQQSAIVLWRASTLGTTLAFRSPRTAFPSSSCVCSVRHVAECLSGGTPTFIKSTSPCISARSPSSLMRSSRDRRRRNQLCWKSSSRSSKRRRHLRNVSTFALGSQCKKQNLPPLTNAEQLQTLREVT